MLNTYNPKFNRAYEDVIRKLDLCGVVPLIKIDDTKKALPLAGSLLASDIRVIEISFRTSIASEAIRILSQKCPGLIVGAGTVIDVKQVQEAVNAGAEYIITPAFNATVVDRCIELGIPVFPGCSTASDIEQAYLRGLRVVKFFPSELLGGIEMLKTLSRPYPFMKFIPAGGINSDNLKSYLAFNKVLCCVGSFIVDENALDNNRFDVITRKAREAVNEVIDIQLSHIAFNVNQQTAVDVMKVFSRFDGQNYNPAEKKVSGIEVVTEKQRDANGHVVFSTPNLERCIYYLRNRGFVVAENSIVKDSNKIIECFLSGVHNGFEIKLIRR